MALTRRALLERVGAVGGLGAAYLTMEMLGLAIPTPAGAETFGLPPSSGNGRSILSTTACVLRRRSGLTSL